MLLNTWQIIELDARNVRRISVLVATLNHITWESFVDKPMTNVADSVKKNSSNHLQVWNQHSEMCVERVIASTLCNNLVIKFWPVVTHVLDPLEKSSACHVLKMSVLQKCKETWNLMSTNLSSALFVTAPHLDKSHVFNLDADIFSMLVALRRMLWMDTMVLV